MKRQTMLKYIVIHLKRKRTHFSEYTPYLQSPLTGCLFPPLYGSKLHFLSFDAMQEIKYGLISFVFY